MKVVIFTGLMGNFCWMASFCIAICFLRPAVVLQIFVHTTRVVSPGRGGCCSVIASGGFCGLSDGLHTLLSIGEFVREHHISTSLCW